MRANSYPKFLMYTVPFMPALLPPIPDLSNPRTSSSLVGEEHYPEVEDSNLKTSERS